MKFLNKRIPLIYVVLILLIIGFVFSSIIYWYGPYYMSLFNLSPEQRRSQELSEMTDQELINEINNLKDPGGIVPETGEERLTYAHKNMINYLICKTGYTKTEESYNLASDFIKDNVSSKENEESILNRLDRGINDFFTIQLALVDFDEICPDKLVDLCIDKVNQFSEEEKEDDIEGCKNICNLIDRYSKNNDELEAEVVNDQILTDKKFLYNQKYYMYRVAMAYRLGEQDLAMKVCDNVDSAKKESCVELINFFDEQRKEIEGCDNIRKELEELISGLSI